MNDAIALITDARQKKAHGKIPDIVCAMETYQRNHDLLLEAVRTLGTFAGEDVESRTAIAKADGI